MCFGGANTMMEQLISSEIRKFRRNKNLAEPNESGI